VVKSLINGHVTDVIDVSNRGLAYGDGLFETIRVIDKSPVWLGQHLARLRRGCDRLQLNLDETLLRAEISSLCQTSDAVNHPVADQDVADQVLKVIITRGAGGRGYRPDPRQGVERILQLSSYVADPNSSQQGIALFTCKTRLARQPLLAGLKHLNRLEQVLAAAELPIDCREGLMQDTAGLVIEGTRSNVFFVIAGQLCTPSLAQAGIDGVLREWLCDVMSVQIRQIGSAEIDAAQEIFVGNSVFGIYPVTSVHGVNGAITPFQVGEMTRACQAQLHQATGIIG
jgi:4-amino-4-deoxychorismate lyase